MPTPPTLRPLAPQHSSQRSVLRRIGWVMVAVGVPVALVGGVDFFRSLGGHSGPPTLFWCLFVGLPLIAFGVRLLKLGYLGSIARYVASEAAPVAAETTDYLAANTSGAVRTVTRAVASGLREGMAGAQAARACGACGADNATDARFCNQCGARLAAPATCACGAANAAGARFCQRCGKQLPVAG